MKLSQKTRAIYNDISKDTTKLGDLRKLARTIKKDHEMAMELWSTDAFLPRQLAILIMDKKMLTQALIDKLDKDIQNHTEDEQNQLMDWLMANQLTKDKATIALIESWEQSSSVLQRRVFWYYQARLRWMGNTNHSNTEVLLDAIEANMIAEQPQVQWAMNYTAGQIGKWQKEHRQRCINIGKSTGLYRDEIVAKGCTPSYLPEFIKIEVAKLKSQ